MTDLLERSHRRLLRLARTARSAAAAPCRQAQLFVCAWTEGKNFGDDYLATAVTKYLAQECPTRPIIQTGLDFDHHCLTRKDIVIIVGGGLWGPSGSGDLDDRLYNRWMRTRARLIIANIGIESFVPRSTDRLIHLVKKAEVFSVRDLASYQIVTNLHLGHKVLWGADSSFLNPIRVTRDANPGCLAVNLCGPEVEEHYRSFPILDVAKAISELRHHGHELKGLVLGYNPNLSDYKYCRLVDEETFPEFSTIPYEKCSICVGTRFHSIVIALQNEIPTIAINYSSKVRRLMDEYGLSDFCLEPDDKHFAARLLTLVQSVEQRRAQLQAQIRAGNELAYSRLDKVKRAMSAALRNHRSDIE